MIKEKIVVIGAGSWGCALARILGDNNHDVIIYDIDKNAVDEINFFHTNKMKLKNGKLPDHVKATTDLEHALTGGNVILLATPTAVIRLVLKQIAVLVKKPVLFINSSKGIEPFTFKRVSQIVNEEIPSQYVEGFVCLTGPSHAEEVILQKLTAITSACDDIKLAKRVQVMFSNETYFRVYALDDLIGAELGGALKNIYALAAGIADGLSLGENAKAALIARAITEMKRLAVVLGAKEHTLYGLSGIGDLIVTCTSRLSRNFQAGVKIGGGCNLKETLGQMTMVVEGARSCQSAYQAARFYQVDTPIIDTVYQIIYEQMDPKEAITQLMKRSLKEEGI